jgi:hypothetical protein
MTHTVTTVYSEEPIEVDDAEYLDLSRQGLLVEDDEGKKTKKKTTTEES